MTYLKGVIVGVKDWLAKRAGVGAYGEVMGREAVKNGLGRWLYLGHGTGVPAFDRCHSRLGYIIGSHCPAELHISQ
jgi:hypothetical protein